MTIETGDWGVFVTCDLGREPKCIAEVLDIFSQVRLPGENVTFLIALTHGVFRASNLLGRARKMMSPVQTKTTSRPRSGKKSKASSLAQAKPVFFRLSD